MVLHVLHALQIVSIALQFPQIVQHVTQLERISISITINVWQAALLPIITQQVLHVQHVMLIVRLALIRRIIAHRA